MVGNLFEECMGVWLPMVTHAHVQLKKKLNHIILFGCQKYDGLKVCNFITNNSKGTMMF